MSCLCCFNKSIKEAWCESQYKRSYVRTYVWVYVVRKSVTMSSRGKAENPAYDI